MPRPIPCVCGREPLEEVLINEHEISIGHTCPSCADMEASVSAPGPMRLESVLALALEAWSQRVTDRLRGDLNQRMINVEQSAADTVKLRERIRLLADSDAAAHARLALAGIPSAQQLMRPLSLADRIGMLADERERLKEEVLQHGHAFAAISEMVAVADGGSSTTAWQDVVDRIGRLGIDSACLGAMAKAIQPLIDQLGANLSHDMSMSERAREAASIHQALVSAIALAKPFLREDANARSSETGDGIRARLAAGKPVSPKEVKQLRAEATAAAELARMNAPNPVMIYRSWRCSGCGASCTVPEGAQPPVDRLCDSCRREPR